MRKFSFLPIIITFAVILVFTGCSTGSSVVPDQPTLDSTVAESSGSVLWGSWLVDIREDGYVTTVPLRQADFALNVVGAIDSSPGNLAIHIVDLDVQPGYTDIILDIGLQHPFATEPKYTGFDVCGIVMGSADTTHPYDPTLLYGGPSELTLLNPDGFTRWMNRPEFSGISPSMFGYIPGKLGTPGFDPDATLNAYKYFCDGMSNTDNAFDYLAANPIDRGLFNAGSINSRRYELRSPGTGGIMFQYAVLARWEPNANAPDDPDTIPDDFPPEANAIEAVACTVTNDTSDMWNDGSLCGGSFIADFSLLNWNATLGTGGEMEEYDINLYSDAWTGPASPNMTPSGSGDNYFTFSADIQATPTTSGPMDVWITVAQLAETYYQPLGTPNGATDKTLAAHFLYTADVSDINPNPNEFWEPPTDRAPRFCFIHHSCGSGFLFSGGMWDMLVDAGFEVHDRTYGDGWVGDHTDPNHWPTTFTEYYDDMMTWEMDDGEEYDIIAFKSCYPACNISSEQKLLDYYGYYAVVKSVTEQHPEALFIPWSPPPLNPTATNPENAARARIFSTWLWDEYDNGEYNMAAFDCFDVLAGTDPGSDDFNCLRYDYQKNTSDSHPNTDGNVAVAEAFTAWITDLVW